MRSCEDWYVKNLRSIRKPNESQDKQRACGKRMFMFRRTFTNVVNKFQTSNDVFKVKSNNDVKVIDKNVKEILNLKEDSTNFTMLAKPNRRTEFLGKETI